MKAKDISCALGKHSKLFGPKQNLFVIENISWGLFSWGECDYWVCSKSMFLTDIEIKISISDLKADFSKLKWVEDSFKKTIKYHYYAIPEKMLEKAELIINESRPNSGIIVLRENEHGHDDLRVILHKRAGVNKLATPIQEKHVINLARLAMFRYWRNI